MELILGIINKMKYLLALPILFLLVVAPAGATSFVVQAMDSDSVINPSTITFNGVSVVADPISIPAVKIISSPLKFP